METRRRQITHKQAHSLRQADNILHLPTTQLCRKNLLLSPALHMQVRQVCHQSIFNKQTSPLHREPPDRVHQVRHLYLKVGLRTLTATPVNITTFTFQLRAHNGSFPRDQRR
jgi:hypothetical protein